MPTFDAQGNMIRGAGGAPVENTFTPTGPRGQVVGFDAQGNEIRGRESNPSGTAPLEFRHDEVLTDIQAGTQTAIDQSNIAGQLAVQNLQPFTDQTAFNEQSALLGAFGEEAQAAAIAGIPQSEFQQEQNTIERRSLLRQAAGKGRRGSGATAGRLAELGSAQQARAISDRLNALAPISDISLGAASTVSGLEESRLARQAQLLAGSGQQQAQILLGQAATEVGASSTAAQLAGLQDISQGNVAAGLVQQGGQLAGQLFQQPATVPPPVNLGVIQGTTAGTFTPGAGAGPGL